MTRAAPVRRTTARVVPVDVDGRVLLLRGRDPARPDRPHWFTIGGAVEPGETVEAAAVRELHEETGIELSAEHLGEPFHRGRHDYRYGGVLYRASSTFFAVPMGRRRVVFDGVEPGEIITDARWWQPEDLVGVVALSNLRLPELMARAVRHVQGPP